MVVGCAISTAIGSGWECGLLVVCGEDGLGSVCRVEGGEVAAGDGVLGIQRDRLGAIWRAVFGVISNGSSTATVARPKEFVNEPTVKKSVVETSEAKASADKPKVVRKNNGAPIIED
ncbi:hypothetical protein Tco_1404160 [Tanacetum coccineum]